MKCGRCCQERENCFTFIFENDSARISNALKVKEGEFLERYTQTVEYINVSLNEKFKINVLKVTKFCVFFRKGQCRIHQFKPLICKLGPIITPNFSKDYGFDHWYQYNCKGVIKASKNEIYTLLRNNNSILYNSFEKHFENQDSKKIYYSILSKRKVYKVISC